MNDGCTHFFQSLIGEVDYIQQLCVELTVLWTEKKVFLHNAARRVSFVVEGQDEATLREGVTQREEGIR